MKKVLLIGYGRFGKILFEKLRAMSEVNVTIATHNYQKHLAGADWAVIATPVDTHTAIAGECLAAGLNVFSEKPLGEHPYEVEELILKAQKAGKRLYIDDVFCYRKEFATLKSITPISSVDFLLQKYGTFNDTILVAHVYHDLYLLVDLVGFGKIENIIITKKETPLEKDRVDILEFSFMYNGILVTGSYDRTRQEKIKKITLNKNTVWLNNRIIIDSREMATPKHDAIADMLTQVIEEKADFTHNNKLALEATRLLAVIAGKNKMKRFT